jgi:hypothetical protein
VASLHPPGHPPTTAGRAGSVRWGFCYAVTMPQHSDTTPQATQVQVDIWRRMGPEGRVSLMLEMCEQVANTSKAGIRQRHPDYSNDQVQDAFLFILWGRETYQRVFPTRTLPVP